METLRSLRHVIARIRKPGSARRAPVRAVVRVVVTSGVLISALALVGVGAAEAATGGHAGHTASHTHTSSAQSVAVGHGAKAHAPGTTKTRAVNCKATVSGSRTGPWMFVTSVKGGPWMFTANAVKGPWMFVTSVKGPWMFASPACANRA